jgi:hypothetical protein
MRLFGWFRKKPVASRTAQMPPETVFKMGPRDWKDYPISHTPVAVSTGTPAPSSSGPGFGTGFIEGMLLSELLTPSRSRSPVTVDAPAATTPDSTGYSGDLNIPPSPNSQFDNIPTYMETNANPSADAGSPASADYSSPSYDSGPDYSSPSYDSGASSSYGSDSFGSSGSSDFGGGSSFDSGGSFGGSDSGGGW